MLRLASRKRPVCKGLPIGSPTAATQEVQTREESGVQVMRSVSFSFESRQFSGVLFPTRRLLPMNHWRLSRISTRLALCNPTIHGHYSNSQVN